MRFYRYATSLLLPGCLTLLMAPYAAAQRPCRPAQPGAGRAGGQTDGRAAGDQFGNRPRVDAGWQDPRYKATAGNLLIDGEDEKPYGSVFYVAYTLADVGDPRKRPVTFLYNGGPGSASMWLHMGSVGPVRVATASPEATGAAPYQVIPNPYSLLDKTDLVFVDAVGTGYSRPVGRGAIKIRRDGPGCAGVLQLHPALHRA